MMKFLRKGYRSKCNFSHDGLVSCMQVHCLVHCNVCMVCKWLRHLGSVSLFVCNCSWVLWCLCNAATTRSHSLKTTKKARREANKDWKVCVPNCFHDGNNKKGKVVQCHLCQIWINSECVSQKRQRYCRNIDLSDLPHTATTGSIIRAGGNDGSPRGIEQATRCPRRRATTGDERPMR